MAKRHVLCTVTRAVRPSSLLSSLQRGGGRLRIRFAQVLSSTWGWTHVSKPPWLWSWGWLLHHCWLWSGCLPIHFSDLQSIVYLGHPSPAWDFPHPAIWHLLWFHSHSPSSEQKPQRKLRCSKKPPRTVPLVQCPVLQGERRKWEELLERILKVLIPKFYSMVRLVLGISVPW